MLASYADRLTGDALGGQSLRGYLSGSVDVVLRFGGRYLVVDYKTNWLGDGDRPLTSADYDRARMTEAMLHSDYPLQALLYSVVLHRYLRWRQPAYEPSTHLGGVMYLFLRGMCGADTPVVDGHPAGVFSWQPPAALITDLSDLLDAGRCGGMTVELAVNDVFEPADVHVARRLTALREEPDERVALAVAFVVRALRGGSVCVDLNSAELADLAEAVKASPLLEDPPILRLERDPAVSGSVLVGGTAGLR